MNSKTKHCCPRGSSKVSTSDVTGETWILQHTKCAWAGQRSYSYGKRSPTRGQAGSNWAQHHCWLEVYKTPNTTVKPQCMLPMVIDREMVNEQRWLETHTSDHNLIGTAESRETSPFCYVLGAYTATSTYPTRRTPQKTSVMFKKRKNKKNIKVL